MSPPRKNGPTAEEKLQRIHDLEGDFYAVANAAGICWDLLEALFDGSQTSELTGNGRIDLYSLDPQQLDRFHYAVSDSWAKARKLRDELHAALGYVEPPAAP